MKRNLSFLIKLPVMFCMLLMLGGCAMPFTGKNIDQVVLTTGFRDDEVFRIGTAVCSEDEYMLYLTNTQNQYEQVYGSEIWSVASENTTLEDKIKNMVGALLAQVKTMNLLAKENHVSVTDEENRLIDAAAQEYYDSLSDHEIEALHLTKEAVAGYYSEYLIAHKVYTDIICDINPEISDDEARTVTVDWIYIKSSNDDEQARQRVYGILSRVRGGEDFESVAVECSDDAVVAHSFCKGTEPAEIEKAAFDLAEGEISDVIYCEDGYYILKCVSMLNREETDNNKIKMVEQRKNETFHEVYGSFAMAQVKQLNEKKWNEITLLKDDQIQTSDFFDVYEKYLGNSTDQLQK